MSNVLKTLLTGEGLHQRLWCDADWDFTLHILQGDLLCFLVFFLAAFFFLLIKQRALCLKSRTSSLLLSTTNISEVLQGGVLLTQVQRIQPFCLPCWCSIQLTTIRKIGEKNSKTLKILWSSVSLFCLLLTNWKAEIPVCHLNCSFLKSVCLCLVLIQLYMYETTLAGGNHLSSMLGLSAFLQKWLIFSTLLQLHILPTAWLKELALSWCLNQASHVLAHISKIAQQVFVIF